MASWAYNMLQEMGAQKDVKRRAFDGPDPYLISYIKMGRMTFSKIQKEKGSYSLLDFSRKRVAL